MVSQFVYRIESAMQDMDPDNPFSVPSVNRAIGTAFTVDALRSSSPGETYLVTAYHCVRSAQKIRVRLPSREDVLDGEVMASVPYMDVALIRIQLNTPSSSLVCGKTFELSLGDEVVAYGFGNGSPFINMTTGVLSGRERTLVFTSPINGGNSGGPLVRAQDGQVYGIVISSLQDSQNTNYAVPVDVAIQALRRCIDSRQGWLMDGKLVSRFSVLKTTPRYSEAITGGASKQGALIGHVTRGSTLHTAGIEEGDVITKVKTPNTECVILSDFSFNTDVWKESSLPMGALDWMVMCGDDVELFWFSSRERAERSTTVRVTRNMCTYRHIFHEFEQQPIVCLGGLVFAMLAKNNASSVYYQMDTRHPAVRDVSMVVLLHACAETPFEPANWQLGDILVRVNDRSVKNLKDVLDVTADFAEQYGEDDFLTITFHDSSFAASTWREVVSCDDQVLRGTNFHAHKILPCASTR
jgi:S1-C subfamily serine protease